MSDNEGEREQGSDRENREREDRNDEQQQESREAEQHREEERVERKEHTGGRRERKDPPNIDGMFTLKVDNINHRVTNEILKEKFSAFGEIGDIYIPRLPGSTDPRGYAFVRFLSQQHAEDAMQALNNADLEGTPIRVQEAKAKRPENPRQYYSKGNGRGGGNRPRNDSRDRRDYRRDSRDRDRGREYRDYRRDDEYRREPDYRDRRPPSRERSRSRERNGGGRPRSTSRDRRERYAR